MPETVGNEANYVGKIAPEIYLGINLFSSAYENGKLTITRPAEGFENAKIYALYPQGYEPTGKVVWQESGYTLTENT